MAQTQWPIRAFIIRRMGHHARYVLRDSVSCRARGCGMIALRIAWLCHRYGMTPDRAAMLASLIWGGAND